ncbi:hypothetical protein AB0C59_31715 [Streptomyces sp. NPDC048664]|uniref:hypothetical protein n=1 Tax=Streptomyces sp. NPDC048664 TaxID=3154505 RepID=UPI00342A1BC6
MLTATAAGTLLGALWFVPSANATQESPGQQMSTSTSVSASSATADSTTVDASTAAAGVGGTTTGLADTGSVDTTPYVLGGTLFLSLGAGFLAYSVRRERMGF